MIKKLLLLSAIVSITACKSYSPESQCDPEKNYIKSNPEGIEEFKDLQKKGLVKSIFYNKTNKKKCEDDLCAKFDKKYDFMEVYYNDDLRKGVYTITTSKDFSNKNCLKENDLSKNAKDKYCYIITKNPNDIIKSRYEVELDDRSSTTILKLKDLNKQIILSEFSYQVYSTGAIGGPGGGVCQPQFLNNPDYKYDPYNLQ